VVRTNTGFVFAELTLRRILYNWTGLWDFGPIWTLDGTGLPHISRIAWSRSWPSPDSPVRSEMNGMALFRWRYF